MFYETLASNKHVITLYENGEENTLQLASILALAPTTTYSRFPCKAVLNRWRQVISSAMGYYDAEGEIRITRTSAISVVTFM